MAIVDIEKISEHTAQIKGRNTVVWRIQIDGSIDEYYVEAKHVHSKLGGGYWIDTKHTIPLANVNVPEPFTTQYQAPQYGSFVNIRCGHCGIITQLNMDTLAQNQGAHYCKNCRDTIAIVIGLRINLRNGSKDESIITR